jgi:hypothetical protein
MGGNGIIGNIIVLLVDDITIYNNATQMIINGGFETGDLTGWNRTGNCSNNVGEAYYGSSYAHTGNYYYYDPCVGGSDYLTQTISTVPSDTYVITFWLTNYLCCDPTEIANITIF